MLVTLYKIGGVHFCLLGTNGFHERQRTKDLLLRARVVVKTSNMKISRRCLADYVKTLHQISCSTIIFLHSTNQIIDLWRCCWRCRRQILKLPMLCSLLQLLSLVCCVRRHGKLASSFYKCSRYEVNIGSKRQKNCFFDLTHSWRVLTLGTKMYREQLLFTSALQYWASKKNWVYLEGCSIVLTDRLSGEK